MRRERRPLTPELWMSKMGEWFVPEPNTGCWLWMMRIDEHGYGRKKWRQQQMGAHLVSWIVLRGPIPDGLTIDHLCRCRSCVNPDHMEPVTNWENTRRGINWAGRNARKTHCIHGHPFTPDNTYIDHSRGWRQCKACTKRRNDIRRLTSQPAPKNLEVQVNGCGDEWCLYPWSWMTALIEGLYNGLKMAEAWAGGGTEVDGGYG